MREISGLICAMVTPMTGDCVPDHVGIRKLVNRVIEGGVGAILVPGTTGEGTVIPDETWREVLETSIEAIAGRVPVIVGTTDTGARKAVNKSKLAKKAGADAALLMPPMIFAYESDDICNYYQTVYEKSGLPIIIYNFFPKATKTAVSVPMLERLVHIPGIVGLKDSSGDLVYLQRAIKTARGTNFKIYQGLAGLSFVSLLAGAHGVFSATSNLIASIEQRLADAIKHGDLANAKSLQEAQLDVLATLSFPNRPIFLGVKAALEYIGLIESHVAAPYSRASQDTIGSIGKALEGRGLFEAVNSPTRNQGE